MLKKLVPLVFAAALLGGCAGKMFHPLDWTGTYQGTFDSPSTGETGPMTISVIDDGSFTGTFTNNLTNLSGTITGTISKAGHLDSKFTYSDAGSTVMHVVGKVTKTNVDTPPPGLAGSGTQTTSAGTFPFSFTLGQL